ncbi:hypothetical protein BRYFOR_06445 [Marvinbryantia formatexigens DSM 14469]|uniref:Uncharacterized protein n=1 Tax=Marvinbryantia formatexigens DSM 14469 TaxID=478749 RepID=C6LCU7_9FIRM|nr:hypothetical protein BRYFOR_06445 [Marvinbryantia formatexigens DSM 14469]
MKGAERRLRAGNTDAPDAGRWLQKPQNDELRAGGIFCDFIGNLQDRALRNEAVGAARARTRRNARDGLTERGGDGDTVQIGGIRPDFQEDPVRILIDQKLRSGGDHRGRLRLVKMMRQSGLVARCRCTEAAKIVEDKGKIALQRGISAVVALVCAKADADDERKAVACGKREQIAQSHHDIGFLESDGALADKKIIAQVLFGGLELYRRNFAGGRSAGKFAGDILASGGDAGDKGAVSILILLRDDFVGIIRAQGAVDVFRRIAGAVAHIKGRAGGGARLVPDAENPGVAGERAESGACIINAGIQKAEENILAAVAKRGLRLHPQNPGHLQAGCVERRKKLWCQRIIDALRQTAGNIAQMNHAEARTEKLRAKMRVGFQKIFTGNGNGKYGVKIIIGIYFVLQGRFRHRLFPSFFYTL